MSRRAKTKVSDDPAPNLIPMIDIMFLLLLFFMLSADMGQRELEEVMLPKAMSVKEDKAADGSQKIDRLTINIYHVYAQPGAPECPAKAAEKVCRNDAHWKVGVKGRDFTDPEKLYGMLKKEAAVEMSKDPKTPGISERKVMIRADSSSPYGLAQKSMNVCAKAGIYKIDVGAARPADAK